MTPTNLKTLENDNDPLLRKIKKIESEVTDLKVDLSQFKACREASDDKIKKLKANLRRSSDDVLGQSLKIEL